MQEAHYDELRSQLANQISDNIPEASRTGIHDRVRESFERLKADGHLDSLTLEEVCLLEDFRVWKSTIKAGQMAFHWKRRSA